MRLLNTLAAIFIAVSGITAGATEFKPETLNYVISYKWGLVHKDAGEAILTLRESGDKYKLRLTGMTKPWADKFYMVRDTLLATVRKDGFKPLSYSKIAHEDGKFSRDDITYSYGSSSVGGHSVRTRIDKKGNKSVTEKKFSATGATYDMLSVFYFLRTIDYSALTKDKQVKASLFSGSKVETVTVRYVGKEKLKLRDKSTREAYHIKFRFTTAGQKKSSDDLDAWISTDSAHIPLQVVGSLPVGQVRCCYVGGGTN